MKKFLCILLIVAMLFCFTACPNNESSIIGKWSGKAKIISGIMIETEITFEENGKGYITPNLGVGISFDYSIEDDKITIIPDTPIIKKTLVYEFVLDKKKLVLSDSNDEMVFTKTK